MKESIRLSEAEYMNELRAVKHMYKHRNVSQIGRHKRLSDRPEEVYGRRLVQVRGRRRNALRGCDGVMREGSAEAV